jgi:hypothetical protein
MAFHDPPDWNTRDGNDDMEKIIRRDLYIQRLLSEFFMTNKWSEAQRLVEKNPELLSQEAFSKLDLYTLSAQERRDVEELGMIEEHRSVLTRCLEIGIAAAFREVITGQRWD